MVKMYFQYRVINYSYNIIRIIVVLITLKNVLSETISILDDDMTIYNIITMKTFTIFYRYMMLMSSCSFIIYLEIINSAYIVTNYK